MYLWDLDLQILDVILEIKYPLRLHSTFRTFRIVKFVVTCEIRQAHITVRDWVRLVPAENVCCFVMLVVWSRLVVFYLLLQFLYVV